MASWNGSASWGNQQQWGKDSGKGQQQQWGKDGGKGQQQWGKDGGKDGGKGGKDGGKGKAGKNQHDQWGQDWKPQQQAWGGDSWGGKGKDGKGKDAKGKDAGKGNKGSKGGKDNKGAKGGDSWSQQGAWGAPDRGAEFVEKAKKHTAEVHAIEVATTNIINSNKAVNETTYENINGNVAALQGSIAALEKQQTLLNDLQKTLFAEVGEARKAGASAAAPAKELNDMQTKVKGLWQQASTLLNSSKVKATKLQAEGELKEKEAKDSAAFKSILAKATAETASSEKLALAVVSEAAPLLDGSLDDGEEKDKKIEAIEKEAVEAAKSLDTAKAALNEKMKCTLTYAPEAKKHANESMMNLQKKLTDAQKALAIYKTLKKELPKLVESHKTLVEVTEILAGHDDAISKADGIAKGGDIDTEKIHSIDELLDGVRQAIRKGHGILHRLSKADSATQLQVIKLRTRADEFTKKCDAVIAKIKAPRDTVRAEEAGAQAGDLVEKANAAWSACQDAEMPFLMGVEVLPAAENEEALTACTEASKNATQAVSAARRFISERLKEAGSYEAELKKTTTEALTPLNKKVEELNGFFHKFQKDLSERKVLPMLSEANKAAKACDAQIKAVEAEAKALAAEDIEEQTPEKITGIVDAVKNLLTEANKAVKEARATAKAKQTESKAAHNHPMLVSIEKTLNDASNRLSKVTSAADKAQNMVKSKEMLVNAETKLKEAEEEAEKAKKLVPAEGAKFTADSIKALDEACATTFKLLREYSDIAHKKERPQFNAAANAGKGLPAFGGKGFGKGKFGAKGFGKPAFAASPNAGPALPAKAKAELEKLDERKKAVQAAIDGIKTDSRDKREEALLEINLEEADTKAKAAEAAAEKAVDTEQPFLLGKSLDVKATQELLEQCSAAAKEMTTSISAAKAYNLSKSGELKHFKADAAKKGKEGFDKIIARVQAVSAKLSTFEKDLRDRTKESKMVEANEKLEQFEESHKKTIAAAEPFEKEGAADMSEADAEAPLNAFLEADSDTNKKRLELERFIQARLTEQKGNKENEEALKKMQTRIKELKDEIAGKKKHTASHEKRALGKRLLAKAKDEVGGLDAEVKKATDACASFLEKGGEEFLVSNTIQTLCGVLSYIIRESTKEVDGKPGEEKTISAIFKEVAKGKPINEKTFVKYVTDLATAHDKLSCLTDERRSAVFKRIASNGKAISEADFCGILNKEFVCMKPVTITDKCEVEGAETVCKVEIDNVVTLMGEQKTDEKGLVRSQCQFDGKTGWITVRQNSPNDQPGGKKGHGKKGGKGGERFLLFNNRFREFCKTMEKAVQEASNAVHKASTSLNDKIKQLGKAEEGPAKDAVEEMTKLKETVAEAHKSADELKKKLNEAKHAHEAKEKAESTAHIDARNNREAAAYIDEPKEKMAAFEAAAKAVEEAAAPLVSLSADDLKAFATPASVQDAVEKHTAAVKEAAEALKASIKEKTEAVNKAETQNSGTKMAKHMLKDFSNKVDSLTRKANSTGSSVATKCRSLVAAKIDPVQAALREHIAASKKTNEEFFDAHAKGEKIAEADFCKILESFESEDAKLTPELAKLVCRKLEADGVSKENFMKFVVQYYKVVRGIAFTDAMDITKCKTLRKAEEGEVMELLEGPVTNDEESNKMTRIRARSCKEPHTEGWVTIEGSQGTPFLQKTTKP